MRLRHSVLALLVLLSACTPPLKMESAWLPGARPAQSYSKVLIVAVSEDFDRRRVFENRLASELAAGGTTGIPSTRTMLSADVLDREAVAALVKVSMTIRPVMRGWAVRCSR